MARSLVYQQLFKNKTRATDKHGLTQILLKKYLYLCSSVCIRGSFLMKNYTSDSLLQVRGKD